MNEGLPVTGRHLSRMRTSRDEGAHRASVCGGGNEPAGGCCPSNIYARRRPAPHPRGGASASATLAGWPVSDDVVVHREVVGHHPVHPEALPGTGSAAGAL